jgi:phenylalanyl-tRNA synthetase beta chain
MLISKKWLSEFVDLPAASDRELAERLTLSTVEVERYVAQAESWDKIVVGVIRSIESHPNADRLKVCGVDVGGRVAQIVCGGTNVREGMKVVVALPGSRVRWHGEGDLIELAATKIRGVDSFGMICASAEIGLERASNEGEHDIRPLDVDAAPGTPLAVALGRDDVIFEIDNKSLTNRPDLVSHYGLARELSALYRVPLKEYDPPKIRNGKGDFGLRVTVEDRADCPRYMGVLIEGVEVGQSPKWLQDRLSAVGIRAINNVVDVTNYVMAEGGQSLHAFDAAKLETADGRAGAVEISVRRAKPGEKLTTLDGEVRALDESMLLICDGRKPVVLAGIMGGKDTGVTETTKTIFLESANFHPTVVRKTSQKLSLRSEASMRYEKSLDPALSDLVLRRTVELLKQLHPNAKVVSEVADEYPEPPRSVMIEISTDWLASRLGVKIPEVEIQDILTRLGFTFPALKPLKPSKPFHVIVPSWRATKDISIPEDVAEEVARIWGYDRIPATLPSASITPPPQDPILLMARAARRTLSVGLAATEVYRYAFVSPETLSALGFNPHEHLKLANPLAADRPYLVQSLIPNLLESVAQNQHASPVVSLFEIDRVFFGTGENDQPYHLAIAYSAHGDESPFTRGRQLAETVLKDAGLVVSFGPITNQGAWMHPGRCADILIDGKKHGIIAEALPESTKAVGLDRRVAVAEMNLSVLAFLPRGLAAFTSIPQFPDAKRDLAFVVDNATAYGDIERAIKSASPLLVSLELFDVYRGKNVGEGKKSMAVHLTLRAADKTLSSEEADKEVAKIVKVLEKQFGATMRI